MFEGSVGVCAWFGVGVQMYVLFGDEDMGLCLVEGGVWVYVWHRVRVDVVLGGQEEA